MQKQFKEYQVFDSTTPVAVTSSTDATPIVVTATSHGLSTGDKVLIYGHTTNVAANGIYQVTRITANTFSLQNQNTGANIAGSGAGAGSSGVLVKNPKVILAQDFANAEIALSTSGTATTTIKVAGSFGLGAASASAAHGDTPNFGATVAATNPYSFLQIVDLDGATSVDGSTGVVVAGTDINKSYRVNIEGVKYLTLIPVSWSAGSITAKVTLYTNQ